MKTPTRKERAALEKAEEFAAYKERRAREQAAKVADQGGEVTRWAAWEAVSPNDRMRAIGLAGFPRNRASDPIASFTDAERATIREALAVHISHMEFIIQCMNGANTTRLGYLH